MYKTFEKLFKFFCGTQIKEYQKEIHESIREEILSRLSTWEPENFETSRLIHLDEIHIIVEDVFPAKVGPMLMLVAVRNGHIMALTTVHHEDAVNLYEKDEASCVEITNFLQSIRDNVHATRL